MGFKIRPGIQFQTYPPSCYITLGKLLNSWESPYPRGYDGNNTQSTWHIELTLDNGSSWSGAPCVHGVFIFTYVFLGSLWGVLGQTKLRQWRILKMPSGSNAGLFLLYTSPRWIFRVVERLTSVWWFRDLWSFHLVPLHRPLGPLHHQRPAVSMP